MARESGGRGGSKALRREQDSRDKGIEELQQKNAKLIDDLARTNRDLARTNRDLVRTTRDRDRWKRRSEHLKKQLAAARRAGRRQAAPFAKDRPQGRSGRPGRRPGARYGRQGCRRRPAGVDETHAAPTPRACPDCGGAVEVTRVASQYQEELPKVHPIVRRFDIEVGRCSQCRRRVQGRHRLQTSDALGAAAVQLGPGLASLVVELHTEMGVPLAKVVGLLRTRLGVQVTTGGLARLLHRAARNAMPVYRELCSQVRNAPVVTPTKPAGASAPSPTGCGRTSPRRPPSTPSAPAAASPTPPPCWGPTTPACSCATGGRCTGATRARCTKAVSITWFTAARYCSKTTPTVPGAQR